MLTEIVKDENICLVGFVQHPGQRDGHFEGE